MKKTQKKLALNPQTVRTLTTTELVSAGGGAVVTLLCSHICTTAASCGGTCPPA